MITASFIASPLNGIVYATDFTFTDTTSSLYGIASRSWDLGDGTTAYNTISATKTYNYPGTYIVTLTATDFFNNSRIVTKTISADYSFRDSITFTQIPGDYSLPGKKTNKPFKIQVITSQIKDTVDIDLHVINSKSVPYEFVSKKWSTLTPTWKFLDSNLNPITTLTVTTSPIYIQNNKKVGSYGEAEFYFVDSIGTEDPNTRCPLLITTTLQTSGFYTPLDSSTYLYNSHSNSIAPQAALIWRVHDLLPNTIKITDNYVSDVYPIKWKNIKIPVFFTLHNNGTFIPNTTASMSEVLFNYPENNTFGNLLSVTLRLSGTNNFKLEEPTTFFQSTDSNGSNIGGYIFTSITPTSSINTTSVLASTICFTSLSSSLANRFVYPRGYTPGTFAWLSKTCDSILSKVTLEPYPSSCETINFYKQNNTLIDGYIKTINLPSRTITSTSITCSGIYCVAVDPRNKNLLATDTLTDSIFVYSSDGDLLRTINLSSFGSTFTNFTSGNIANIIIDGNSNVYISLFNSLSVLKLNSNYSFVQSLTGIATNSGTYGTYTFRPPIIETDRSNSVWITYTSSTAGILQLYTSQGVLSSTINLASGSIPSSLAITPTNEVWVANSYSGSSNNGTLQLYSVSGGSALATVSNFTHPISLAIDQGNGIWFLHNKRNIGYRGPTGATNSWHLLSTGSFQSQSVAFQNDTYADKELGGLAVDVYNRVWVIDALTNKAYVFPALTGFATQSLSANIRTVNIFPNTFLYPEDSYKTVQLSSIYFKPVQANGDWTGSKWYQKYYNPASLSAIQISGTSVPITVKDFINPAQINRINENFNNANYIKSLALPNILQQNINLFDNFFAAAVGTSMPSANPDVGQTVYERIANFVINHSDTDTCNIDQLLSQASETNTPASIYLTQYPAEIKKYLDIASVPKNRLWGVKSPIALSSLSIGDKLNTNTSLVTAGTKIYLQSKFDSKYTLYSIPLLSGLMVYPLSSLKNIGFVDPILSNYIFYNYIPVYSNNFIENIIDWNNPYTTLQPTGSTTQEWSGNVGAIETAFNYLLTKYLVVK